MANSNCLRVATGKYRNATENKINEPILGISGASNNVILSLYKHKNLFVILSDSCKNDGACNRVSTSDVATEHSRLNRVDNVDQVNLQFSLETGIPHTASVTEPFRHPKR